MGALSVIPESFAKVQQHLENREAAAQNMAAFQQSRDAENANAVAALNRGSRAAGELKQRGTASAEATRAALAASGVDTSTGTASDLLDTSLSSLDAAQAVNNARADALGHRRSAQAYTRERDKLRRKYQDGGVTGGTADDELFTGLVSNGVAAALKMGTGG
jgi:hypothetical protein